MVRDDGKWIDHCFLPGLHLSDPTASRTKYNDLAFPSSRDVMAAKSSAVEDYRDTVMLSLPLDT
jgi:hypothetical protein